MELELQYTELSCCEAGESVTLTQEETLEAAIPEYCPEVTRIVDAVGQLCLREYTSRQISGSVLVTVLYTSEESPGLRSLTLPVPFLTQADDKRLTGCDTVCMANIAQMVNVLQAMILTEGSKMVLTPTYHVFALYAAHQGAQQLESYAETSILRHDEEAVPTLHVSASRAADGKILITVANLDAAHPAEAQVMLGGVKTAAVNGTVLCGTADARNTFTAPNAVQPKALPAVLTADGFTAALPACSVAAFTVTPQ